MRSMLLTVLASLTLLACKSEKTACDKYADMEVRCGDVDGESVRSVAKQFCEGALKDREENVMAKMIALEADCAQTTTDCDAYKACIEEKKATTSP